MALTPLAGLEAEFVFDDAGLHRLSVASGYEAPLVFRDGTRSAPTFSHRFLSSAAYEMILIAINDQPISLRLGVDGGYRNDVVAAHAGWEVRGVAGLRINFWAPAPDADDKRRIQRRDAR